MNFDLMYVLNNLIFALIVVWFVTLLVIQVIEPGVYDINCSSLVVDCLTKVFGSFSSS